MIKKIKIRVKLIILFLNFWVVEGGVREGGVSFVFLFVSALSGLEDAES